MRGEAGVAEADLTIAIVNHETRELLRACLASVVSGAADERPPIVVVDNASADGSAEMVRDEFPCVRLIASAENRGYGAGANLALAACTTRYALLLNADTRLTPGAPATLADYLLRHSRVALAGPRLVAPDGALEPSCHAFPGAATALLELTSVGRVADALAQVPGLPALHPPASAHDRARPVDWVTGAALAIRRDAFDAVGGFDESFFMYWEETDLCYRLAAAGWVTHFVPAAAIVHAGAASTSQRRAEMAFQFLAGLRRFSARHYSPSRRWRLEATLRAILRIRLAQDRLRLRFSRDPAQRQRLAESLAVWRRALDVG